MEAKVNVNANEIIERLAKLQRDMNFIKEHIEDTTLTDEDLSAIKEAKKDLKEGKTRRL